jgi:hypothetical protein
MINKLFVPVGILAALLLAPLSVSAHELVKDQVGDAGALMYISPEDDPVAGEQATLFFEISHAPVTVESSTLTITNDHGNSATLPTTVADSTLSASYTFPKAGAYQIKLTLKEGGKIAHTFSESVRVSGGEDQAAPGAPTWAVVAITLSGLALAVVTFLVFRRRKAINRYSKV